MRIGLGDRTWEFLSFDRLSAPVHTVADLAKWAIREGLTELND